MQIEQGPGRGLSQAPPGPGWAGKRTKIDDFRSPPRPPEKTLKLEGKTFSNSKGLRPVDPVFVPFALGLPRGPRGVLYVTQLWLRAGRSGKRTMCSKRPKAAKAGGGAQHHPAVIELPAPRDRAGTGQNPSIFLRNDRPDHPEVGTKSSGSTTEHP